MAYLLLKQNDEFIIKTLTFCNNKWDLPRGNDREYIVSV